MSIKLNFIGYLLKTVGWICCCVARWLKFGFSFGRIHISGALNTLSQKRGRPKTKTPQEEQIALLKAENQRLKDRLAEAGIINDIQKKVSALLGNRIKKPNQKR